MATTGKYIASTGMVIKNDQDDLKALVATSEPYVPGPLYSGPPIGFSARVIWHYNDASIDDAHVYGNMASPRPRYYELYGRRECETCTIERYAATILQYPSHYQFDSGSNGDEVGGAVREEGWWNPRAIPQVRMYELLERAEQM